MISPNLRAALEYEEQKRNSSDQLAGPCSRPPSITKVDGPGAGLPPPPRPKSRASSLHQSKSPPTSPTGPFTGLQDILTPQPSPLPTSTSSSGHDGNAITSNPYINPSPLVPHFLAEGNTTLAHSRSFSLPIGSPRSLDGSTSSPRTSESPQNEKYTSPLATPSPDSAEGSKGSETRAGFQRHLRYLSSLQKVEKILVKGKTRAVGKHVDGRDRDDGGRRGSVSGSPEDGHPGTSNRKRLPGRKPSRRIREQTDPSDRKSLISLFASSAPSSPVGPLQSEHSVSCICFCSISL